MGHDIVKPQIHVCRHRAIEIAIAETNEKQLEETQLKDKKWYVLMN